MNCSAPQCNRHGKTRGLCTLHYQRWLRYGRTDVIGRCGPLPKLTYSQLRRIDRWWSMRIKYRQPVKAIAGKIGCCGATILNAAMRRGSYADCPRG
jgi:hypothetical protein